MNNDIMSILKAGTIKIDDETVMIVSEQYHVEAGSNGKKYESSKSVYRFVARVEKLEDIKARIAWCLDEKNRLAKATWPNDDFPWNIAVGTDSSNYGLGNWLFTKIRPTKMMDWETGQKFLKGWKKQTANTPEHVNPKAAYQIENYKSESGDLVSLDNKEALLKHIGQNLVYVLPKRNKKSIAMTAIA